jgi:hypothetical protein
VLAALEEFEKAGMTSGGNRQFWVNGLEKKLAGAELVTASVWQAP